MYPIGKKWLPGLLLLLTLALNAQTKQKLWTIQADSAVNLNGPRWIAPNQYLAFNVDTSRLKALLFYAPNEQEVAVAESPVRINVPWPDGGAKTFQLVRYNMMEPGLAERFPNIVTGYGVSESRDGYMLRFDWTEQGFHAMVTGPGQSVYIDPYCRGNKEDYVVYFKDQAPVPMDGFPCHVEEKETDELDFGDPPSVKSGDCVFRSYRLAVATTAQYAHYHGAYEEADVALVLSAVTTVINRVNQVYERDLTIRLILAANTDAVFFYNMTSQPYQNTPNPTELATNQMTLDAVIGPANYDIGHLFCTGSGGLATAASVCKSNKARGVTGLANPIGDPFYIDFVSHEIGHQFGASHTQNNNCNRNLPTAMEVGSGSTIMGYAGVCFPNVQPNSDDYFHGISLVEIGAYITVGIGNLCDTPLPLDLELPAVDAGKDHSIPVSTPFVLDAVTSGSGGGDLYINWEQWDNSAGPVMPPVSTNVIGPLFRSTLPSISTQRYFPQLSDLVQNIEPMWEVLPSESRDLNFQVTVRSMSGAQGCSEEDQLHLSVKKEAGPFLVNAPNTPVSWMEGESRVVSWDVADTDLAPVNCEVVDIRMSYDGGLTYPKLLAGSTPNTGSATIFVPAGTSSQARVMVKAADNVFFDISDQDFTIQQNNTPGYTLEPQTAFRASCQLGLPTYPINIGQLAGYTDPVTLTLDGAPEAASYNFSTNPVNPGESTSLYFYDLESLTPGDYSFTLRANSNGAVKELTLYLEVMEAPGTVLLSEPGNLQVDLPLQPTVSWQADVMAETYRLEMAESPAFNDLLLVATTVTNTYTPPFELPAGTDIFWRVRARNECTGTWSEVRRFKTIPCVTYQNSTAVSMPNGVALITSVIPISETGTVQDLSVIDLQGTHDWISDLTFSLVAPDNTEVVLLDRICGSEDDFQLNLDDEAPLTTFACPPTDNGFYQPEEALSAMDGKSIYGDWTLKLTDHFSLSAPGELQHWGLQVCASGLSGVALPVELLAFTANADQDYISLHWSTASELNNRGFEIQRRSSENPSFQVIGWQDGRGTTEVLTEYTFIDRDVEPGVKYYYRLYQIDENGFGVFSPVRSARLWKDRSLPVRVYPNPVSDQLSVEMWESMHEALNLVLTDAHGKVVYRTEMQDSKSRIDMSAYASGVYCLHVHNRFDSWVVKVVR